MLILKKRLFTCSILLFTIIRSQGQLLVSNLKCEYSIAPTGIQVSHPRFSWFLRTGRRNCRQIAYRIIVSDDSLRLQKNKGNIWDSRKVSSDASIQVRFEGKSLAPVKTYYWRVRAWDNHGNVSPWSKPARWQMGLVSGADWKGAQWIGYDALPDSQIVVPAITDPDDKRWTSGNDVLPLLRREFVLSKPVSSATAFITGLGQFDFHLNGEKVGDHFLDPGWTRYDTSALYVAFDITTMLKPGKNAVGVMLGNGFYFIPGERYHKLKQAFGHPKMICKIVIKYTDGTEESIISDSNWKTTPGPVTFSSIYGGEDYNATQEKAGWDTAGYNDGSWTAAIVTGGPAELRAQNEAPLKIFEQFSCKKIMHPKPGVWVYDMGQNASAIPFIAVSGEKGAVIKITPAELLDDNGLADQAAIGTPVFFKYTLKGGETESWQPRFMYYGFRYLQVEGGTPVNQYNPEQLPVIKEVKSLHTRNAAESAGTFSCSSALFNQTFKLIDWAVQSNIASIFTDCPHREKLGWLEEAHLTGSAIRYNYDIAALLRKVIADMRESQTTAGLVPDIAPEYARFDGGFRDSPEWGSSAILLPFYLYQWYGDEQALSDSYEMMRRYVAYLDSKSRGDILYFGLGDWYDIGPKDPGPSQLTPPGITATAIYYHDLCILAGVAHILHKTADERRYKLLGNRVKQAYNKAFFNRESGQYGTGSQTANAISVFMGLVDPAYKTEVVNHIIQDIQAHNNSITAGDIGFRYLLKVLDDAGRSDIIFDMNSRTDVPGYGFQLAKGATALTESWQGNRISSNNHLMLGHLMEWFYSGLAGIRYDESAIAFRKISIRPEVVGNITATKASYLSPYGMIKNEWHRSAHIFTMKTEIPANTTAVIYLPAGKENKYTEGGRSIENRGNLKFLGLKNGKALVSIGSGKYFFTVR